MTSFLFIGGPNHGKTIAIPDNKRVVKTTAPRTSGIGFIDFTYYRGTFGCSTDDGPGYVDVFVQDSMSSTEALQYLVNERPELFATSFGK